MVVNFVIPTLFFFSIDSKPSECKGCSVGLFGGRCKKGGSLLHKQIPGKRNQTVAGGCEGHVPTRVGVRSQAECLGSARREKRC